MPLSANLGKKLRETLDKSLVRSQDSGVGIFDAELRTLDSELTILKPLFELQQELSHLPKANELLIEQIETDEGAGDINLTLDNGYTGSYVFADDNVSLTLHGKSDVCFTYTGSRGRSDMSDFKVKKMVIEYGGVTDTHVWVTDEMDATIFHTGNIKYKGIPVISRERYYGSGRLIYTP